MRILHVISSVNPKGGGPIEGVRQLHLPLAHAGHCVEIVSLDSPDSPYLLDFPITVHPMGPSRLGYAYSSRLIPWLRKNASRFDAVIVNGIWQYHSFATFYVLAGSKTPYFVFSHGMLDPWFKYTYPLKHLKKWLYWPWAEYRVLRDARAVIFTCEEERLLARESFWLYKVNEAVTAYGTSSPPQDASSLSWIFFNNFPELRGKRLVLFLSRIQEKKGCDLLIDAFAKVCQRDPSLHLVMAGPDQTGWVAKLQTQAIELGIADRISWVGMLQGEIKWGAYHSAEVFCLPSHQENFGIVVAEALACGKPVLISNKVNIWREILEDDAGFVDTDSVEGTVRNFERWLALQPNDYQKMVARARDCFARRFHIDRAADRLIEIINS